MLLAYTDIETRSPESLKTAGLDRYMTRAECTIVTMAIDNGPVRCWDVLQEDEPEWFMQTVCNPHVTFVAHNAQFDRAGFTRLLNVKTRENQWLCTRAQAYAHGLVGALDALCEHLHVSEENTKLDTGKAVGPLFWSPKKDGTYNQPWELPDEWEQFKNYAMRDVDALRSVHRRLPAHNYQGVNLEYFWLDLEINERGFAVDLPLIDAAADLLARTKRDGDAEIAQATGGAVTAITQRNKLLAYLQSKGVQLPNLTKAELENALQDSDLSPEQRFLIAARLEGARASGAKYKRAVAMHVGSRLRYTQQFSGAGRTGRTAHKGFQPGNMPRAVAYNPLAKTLADQHVPVKAKYIDEFLLPAIRRGECDPLITGSANTLCANALRHTIVAEPGNELIVADYKNIESRILAWIAGEDWKLLAYAAADRGEGADLYKLLYSRFFGASMETINDHNRNAGKVVELACGFGGSVGAFVSMAVLYGIDLTTLPGLVLPSADSKAIQKGSDAQWRAFVRGEDYDLDTDVFIACHVLVQAYRGANPRIDSLKRTLGKTVTTAVRNKGSVHEVGRCKIWCNADVLLVELPSGYRLCYWEPLIETAEEIDPETGEPEQREYLSFKRARGKKMIRERSWPGLTLENIVQAIANQLLRYGKIELARHYPRTLVLAVHDEAVAEARIGAIKLKDYIGHLCRGWWWTNGLPLAADGWQGPRYGKR